MTLLELQNVSKTFPAKSAKTSDRGSGDGDLNGEDEITVLSNVNLSLGSDQFIALYAPSGAGKSTLLHIAGLLDKPTSGKVIIDGYDCAGRSDRFLTRLRCNYLGFIYQAHHLLADFTAIENVAIAQMLSGVGRNDALEHARELLTVMGLSTRCDHKPAELSGGEQQRVAVARAIANKPRIILADEPTGNLDQRNGEAVINYLLSLKNDYKVALLIVTHSRRFANMADRILTLDNSLIANL